MLHNNSVLLTSHLMEEIEVLCNRVGIITDGVLRCVDHPQVLKARIDPTLYVRIDLKSY